MGPLGREFGYKGGRGGSVCSCWGLAWPMHVFPICLQPAQKLFTCAPIAPPPKNSSLLIQGIEKPSEFLGSLFTQRHYGYVTGPELVQKQPSHPLPPWLIPCRETGTPSPQLPPSFLTCPQGSRGSNTLPLCPVSHQPTLPFPSLPSPSLPRRSLARAACTPHRPSLAERAIALLIFHFTSPSGFQAQFKLLFEPFPELLSVRP